MAQQSAIYVQAARSSHPIGTPDWALSPSKGPIGSPDGALRLSIGKPDRENAKARCTSVAGNPG
eukprot:1448122-Amphidinium_carterae.1